MQHSNGESLDPKLSVNNSSQNFMTKTDVLILEMFVQIVVSSQPTFKNYLDKNTEVQKMKGR